MSTEESRAQDELTAWKPEKIEFAIAVSITMIIAGETVTGQADFTHESVEGEDLDYQNMTITWFESNCEPHNVSWDVEEAMTGLLLSGFPLSDLEAISEEFNFDVDYQEV